jgi:FkbM family methyltransferase
MTPEQIADKASVWKAVAENQPDFTHDHDAADNYHAVREIVLGGSLTWARAHSYFLPWRNTKVMDIGANAGVYSAFCGIHEADVVAYEPFPEAYSLLSGMVERTGLQKRIKAVNAAVWTYTGTIPYIGHRTPNEDVTCFNGGIPTDGVKWLPADYEKAVTAQCVSFDDAVGDTEWDCIKIDTEGAEFEMLLAASPAALKRVKFAYVELHDWASQRLYNEMLKKLQEFFRIGGYRAEKSLGTFEALYLFRK